MITKTANLQNNTSPQKPFYIQKKGGGGRGGIHIGLSHLNILDKM